MTHAFSLLGESPVFLSVLRVIEKLSRLSAPVLIEGETGTGKEMAARAIHYGGGRRDRPFVPINCGAFPDSLFESELFGHVKGAFTDARENRPGLVEIADSGTMFLDEVDALTSKGQVALLRFLQDGSFRPIGARSEKRVDVRIIAATNADLAQRADAGLFRTDLLFRLRILELKLPPLRERGSDALLLARAFFAHCQRKHECAVHELDESSCDWFCRYRWPGNIRELEGLIYREVLMSDEKILRLAAPALFSTERRRETERRRVAFDSKGYALAKARLLREFDRQYLSALMEGASWNVTRAAQIAGKERRALGKMLKKYGMSNMEPRQS